MFESSFAMAYCVFVVALLGLCMGSFLNCLAWRVAHGESVTKGRSHCVSCGHELAARDLVPVLSWLLLRGKCRYCGTRVSARYPLVEALCSCVFVSLFIRYGLTLTTVELMAFSCTLLVLSLTDLDTYVIPNSTIVAAIVIRLAYIGVGGLLGMHDAMSLLVESLVGAFVVAIPVLLLSLIMDHVLGRPSLGGGDVKLLFVAGLYFGWQQSLFLIILACVLGIVLAAVGKRATNAGEDPETGEIAQTEVDADASEVVEDAQSRLIPFGPAIALSCWVTMLVGPQVVSWYLSLVHL